MCTTNGPISPLLRQNLIAGLTPSALILIDCVAGQAVIPRSSAWAASRRDAASR
jgi:hypothetical protein